MEVKSVRGIKYLVIANEARPRRGSLGLAEHLLLKIYACPDHVFAH